MPLVHVKTLLTRFGLAGLIGLALAAVALPAPAAAQYIGAVLDEVLVTARRVRVDLQKAPIAVSAFTGLDFDQANIARLDNFNGFVPGLTIAKNDGAGRVAAIRGVGWETAQNLSTQPSVLAYIDGVYLANPLALGLDLDDLERIEVYRGPQGTEFGQGTTGGAINLVTKKPDFETLDGSGEIAYGTYNLVRGRGRLNVPLRHNLAARGSVQYIRRAGFAEIEGGTLDGYDLDDANALSARLALRWKPTARIAVDLFGFAYDADHHAAAQKHVRDPNPDRRRLTQDFPGTFALANYTASATLTWETPWNVTIKSLTGWQKLEKRQSVDGDRLDETLTAIDIQGFGAVDTWDVLPFWDNDSDALSQDLNLSYRSPRLDAVLGGYYLHHENSNHFLEANGPSPFSASAEALANPGPASLPPFMSVLNFVEDRRVTRDDAAVYGQLTVRLTDRLALTGGGRWQTETQRDEATQFFTVATRQRLQDDAFTWKLGADVTLSDDHLVYGLVSTGWKNGGTNPGALNGAVQTPVVFKPETVTALELGAKNTFGQGRARLNAAAFYYDYAQLQFMQEDPVPFAGGTGNIPRTAIYGIETEFSWLLADTWLLEGHAAWMDGQVTRDVFTLDVIDFREALAPGVGLFTDAGFETRTALAGSTNLRGNTPPKLVDLSARLGLTKTHTFAGGAVLTARAEYIHRGAYQYRVFNNPLVDTVPAYNLINLFVQYEPARHPLALSLSITNLTDVDGVNARFSNPFGLFTTSEEYIPPLEVIGALRYSFRDMGWKQDTNDQ